MDIPIPKKTIINLKRANVITGRKVTSKRVDELFARKISMHPLGCRTELASDELNPRYRRIGNFRHVDVIELELGDVLLPGEEDYEPREHVREGSRILWLDICHDP